jgi:hypothetical protein
VCSARFGWPLRWNPHTPSLALTLLSHSALSCAPHSLTHSRTSPLASRHSGRARAGDLPAGGAGPRARERAMRLPVRAAGPREADAHRARPESVRRRVVHSARHLRHAGLGGRLLPEPVRPTRTPLHRTLRSSQLAHAVQIRCELSVERPSHAGAGARWRQSWSWRWRGNVSWSNRLSRCVALP